MTTKQFFSKLLMGMSLAIVVTLIPNALLGELMKMLIPRFPELQVILDMTIVTMGLLPVIMGVLVGIQFELPTLQVASVGLATFIGSGVVQKTEEGLLTLQGIGVVINAGFTAAIAVLFVMWVGTRLKSYSILLLPTFTILGPGLVGLLILPYVKAGTLTLGDGINYVTTLQPVIMGALLAIIFCFIILSPLSTVGVATVVMLSGISAGAANLGIVAAGVGLAIASYRVNSLGTALAHVLGSPKIQMRNFFMKPKIALPMFITAAVLGGLAGVFNIQGTPYSAGFGLSGLVGPLNYINLAGGWTMTNTLIMLLVFFALPIVLNASLLRLFSRQIPWIQSKDYKIDVQ